MCGGFIAAARLIQIEDRVGIEHAQSCGILRREIDMPFRGSRRGEKDSLLPDELAMDWLNGGEPLRHNTLILATLPFLQFEKEPNFKPSDYRTRKGLMSYRGKLD